MGNVPIRGRWSLVTGASSGLGADFAREMAKRGSHVIVVARREERLRELAEELTGEHGVKVEVAAMDLCDPDAAGDLYLRLAEKDISVNVLINNAGVGVHGEFIENHWSREEAMIRLNITSVVQLTKLFLPAMAARGYGRIMRVASTAARRFRLTRSMAVARRSCSRSAKRSIMSSRERA